MPRPNPMRGEAQLGGQLLRMDFDAWMAFELASGRNFDNHLVDMAAGLGLAQAVDWVDAFLAEPHTRANAVALVKGEAGIDGYKAALVALSAALHSFYGEQKKGRGGKADADPPQAG